MIISETFDGWGNKVLQQCFARSLAEKTGYSVKAPKIPWLVNSGDYKPTTHASYKSNEREVFISHKGEMRHKVDMEIVCVSLFNIHRSLDVFSTIEPNGEKPARF